MARAIRVTEDNQQAIVIDSMSIVLAEDRSMLHEDDRPKPFVEELTDNMGGYYVRFYVLEDPTIKRDKYVFVRQADFTEDYKANIPSNPLLWFSASRKLA